MTHHEHALKILDWSNTGNNQERTERVAAALAEKDAKLNDAAELIELAATHNERPIGLYAEMSLYDRLTAGYDELVRERQKLCHENFAMGAEIERLNERFPCGHRKIDWDDSYCECVACKIKQMADDYDRLPHTVFECHDEIAEKDELIEALQRNCEIERQSVIVI